MHVKAPAHGGVGDDDDGKRWFQWFCNFSPYLFSTVFLSDL